MHLKKSVVKNSIVNVRFTFGTYKSGRKVGSEGMLKPFDGLNESTPAFIQDIEENFNIEDKDCSTFSNFSYLSSGNEQ